MTLNDYLHTTFDTTTLEDKMTIPKKPYDLVTWLPLGIYPALEIQTINEIFVNYRGRPLLITDEQKEHKGLTTKFHFVVGYVDNLAQQVEDYYRVMYEPVQEAERPLIQNYLKIEYGLTSNINFKR